jgi:PAS domain S-box-containing protein
VAADSPEAAEAQQRSDAQYRAVVNNAAEAIVVAQDERVVFANPRAAEITGYAPDEMPGLSLRELLHPDDVDLIAERTRQRAEGKLSDPYSYFRIVRKDGELRSVQSCPVTIEWEGRPASLAFIADLSEKDAAARALRASEERLRQVVENVGEGILVADDTGRVVFANGRAAAMGGRTVEELLQMELVDLIHPDDYAVTIERAVARLAGQPVERYAEYRALRKDGSCFWVRSAPVTIDWEGRPAVLTFLVDLTAQRAAEEALRRSEQRYREVVENGSDGIFVLDEDRFVFANSRFQQMVGYTQAELGTMSVFDLVVREDVKALMERHRQRVPDDPRPEESLDWRVRHRDGHPLWIRSRAVRINWDGKPANLAFITDITAQRAAEDALHRSQERYRLVVEHVEEGIIVVQDGVLKLCNPSTEKIVGYPANDLIGHSITHFIHPEDLPKVLTNYQARLRGEPQGDRYDFRVVTKDGRTVWVELGAVLFEWEGRPATLSFLIDVTGRKQAEEATHRALAQQQELNSLKTRFLSMTSHEFRTPLATILSSTELLRYYGDRLPAEEKTELFGTIETAVKRMTQLLEDVLVIGKHDSGAERLVRAPVDVEGFCRALLAEVVQAEEALGRGGRVVELAFEGDCGRAQLDSNQLRHVLVNLLSNAIKYTPAGGNVSLRVRGEPAEVVFSVDDQGIGIVAEDQAHLFELFFRARNVGNISGTGLGLAIVKRAVDLHCGDIGVQSEPGKGTCFTVRLPRGEVSPQAVAASNPQGSEW